MWNLAFLEENRQKIKNLQGIDMLSAVAKEKTRDMELIENAKGVLWMFGIKIDSTTPTMVSRQFF